jgi:DNA-binding MarR family transcriptional regulator
MTAGADSEQLAIEIERLFTLLVSRRARLGDGGSALSVTQRVALVAIVDGGPLRLGALARELGVTEPTATRTADALESMGLVARERDREDRRAVKVRATEDGRAFLAERRQQLAGLLHEPLSKLEPGERASLAPVLEHLNRVLAAQHSAPRSHG